MTEFQAKAKARAAFYAIMEAFGRGAAERIFREVADEPSNAHYGRR